ncbi:replication-relaxation family protein [Streptomyces sp. H27-H1]|uniref:replication-relaxation family protein n=1 Tax=Streptomyces sp. H27-H1 TaxID=2996461 RepID=UPI00226FE961|nr:replication-relaxation family protein [Streptomyces sp. H27-H1]MCY0932040.1 replication-relaxation family protein [Streptomyces sp. H27-H1]
MTSATDLLPSSADTLAHRALALLSQHRLLTTHHLHQMLIPHTPPRKIHNVLAPLRTEGLIAHTVLGGKRGLHTHFLTSAGAQTVSDWPELRGRTPTTIQSAGEASLRAAHTLTGVRAHLTFLAEARAHGDEYEPLDWMPEVTHRLPDTVGEDRLVADALFHYTANHPRRLQYRAFVEIDRTTMSSERLARKLITYARFHDYTPPAGRRGTTTDQNAMLTWQRFYPRFPRLLFVLTGAPRTTLANRIEDLRRMTADHRLVNRLASQVPLGAAILEDLEAQGPRAKVWTSLAGSSELRGWTQL